MSIATELGDGGQTSLPGGMRISKADSRVDAYGTIDELISSIGFGRALCTNAEIAESGRLLELEKNVDSKLRTNAGPRWSRAW